MKKLNQIVVLVGCVLFVGSTYAAGDAEAGKAKSESCNSCHGMNGKSTNPNYPNLAGQKQNYLIKAIKDYRDGNRKDPMMAGMVGSLSDQDIENLAAFYSAVK